jgi:ribosomal protein L24E
MAKRKVFLKYGENTVQINFRVPVSKRSEIEKDVEKLLKKYLDPKYVEIGVLASEVKKESPAVSSVDESVSVLGDTKDAEDIPNWKKNLLNKNKSAAVLKEVAKLADVKTKPTLEDLYDFELASGFPDQDDCVFVDKKLTACYSKYDLGIFYVKFDGRFLKFTNKKSFEKFSKDNLTPM